MSRHVLSKLGQSFKVLPSSHSQIWKCQKRGIKKLPIDETYTHFILGTNIVGIIGIAGYLYRESWKSRMLKKDIDVEEQVVNVDLNQAVVSTQDNTVVSNQQQSTEVPQNNTDKDSKKKTEKNLISSIKDFFFRKEATVNSD